MQSRERRSDQMKTRKRLIISLMTILVAAAVFILPAASMPVKAAGFDMENASDFKLLDRKAVNVLINMREKNAFFRALSSWIGFTTTTVSYEVQERLAG